MKKTLTLLLICMLGSTLANGTTWETSKDGFWQDSTVWLGGIIPDTSSSDTFLIHHAIFIENDLVFQPGAFMHIDSNGGICGHQIATLFGNTEVLVYGILELDELYIKGGFMHCFQGDIVLTTYAQLTGTGATLKVEEDARFVVGEWFDCILPNYAFMAETASSSVLSKNVDLLIYPNPFNNSLNLNNPYGEEVRIQLIDILGKEVYNGNLKAKSETKIDLHHLRDGVYIIHLDNVQHHQKIKVLKN